MAQSGGFTVASFLQQDLNSPWPPRSIIAKQQYRGTTINSWFPFKLDAVLELSFRILETSAQGLLQFKGETPLQAILHWHVYLKKKIYQSFLRICCGVNVAAVLLCSIIALCDLLGGNGVLWLQHIHTLLAMN